MPPDSRSRLTHMLEAAEKAVAWAGQPKPGDLEKNEPLALALVKLIEIIGEAANHVTDADRAAMPEIPWRAIVAMRHNLVHLYFGVDYSLVITTIQDDLPPLIVILKRYLSR